MASAGEFQKILAQLGAVAHTPSRAAPLKIEAPPSDEEILLSKQCTEIGRLLPQSESRIVVADPRVELQHALVVLQERPGKGAAVEDDCYWIADRGTSGGTFVNGRAVEVQRLDSGDLIQIGPRAWLFSHLSPTGDETARRRASLNPVPGIEGLSLDLRKIEVDRKKPVIDQPASCDLPVPVGQFAAIIGPSGGGKSTLLRDVLRGGRGAIVRGDVLADGRIADEERDWFRRQLGYVSQTDALPGDLTAFEAVRFTARLRGAPSDDTAVKRTLRQVDLPDRSWDTLCRNLSGGESKRVRFAAEIIAQPRLFLLDEPGSGLDGERETVMMRLLRALSHRGCTILLVTHNPEQHRHVDRVLEVDHRKLLDDRPPHREPAAHVVRPTNDAATSVEDLLPSPSVEPKRSATVSARGRTPGWMSSLRWRTSHWMSETQRQFLTFSHREVTLIKNAWVQRGLLPVLVVPLLFAIATAVSVPATEHAMLGFLAVLSCIWMGSSLSVMSIVNEREAYDHERLLFLRPVPYVFAKVLVLGLLTLLQTLIFVSSLDGLRGWIWRSDAGLYGGGWTAAALTLVSLAAVGMGLVISALAGTHRPTANFLLPLAMMFQILFSVQVAGNGSGQLHKSYGEFHGRLCSNQPCVRRAEFWRPDLGGWLCQRCQSNPKTPPSRESPIEAAAKQRDLPHRWAARVSFLTLSRWGDLVLRSFAYSRDDFDQFRSQGVAESRSGERTTMPDHLASIQSQNEESRAQSGAGSSPNDRTPYQLLYAYPQWRREAAAVLISMACLLPLGSVVILNLSESALRARMRGIPFVPARGSLLRRTRC